VALAHTSGTISLFPGYTITEEVYRGRRRIVYRGSRDRDGSRVIVKTLLEGSGGTETLGREYELIRSLDLDGVPRAVDLVRSGDRVALVLEDEGRSRLKALIPAGGMDLATFLSLGVQLADVLQGLHHRRVIHKDINPNNILVDPESGRLTLIDFSIASRMPAEHQELRHPSVLEGTLAYLSPEQTGRMNRDIDYRTDFYSLGVTFYEMMTGRLPFESGDPLEVIHGHIARTPRAPRNLRPEIPPPLSDMVMKLLAKAAEERYQSALRLKVDLTRWQAEWDGATSGIVSWSRSDSMAASGNWPS
jgi:serine/threonine protein kinase